MDGLEDSGSVPAASVGDKRRQTCQSAEAACLENIAGYVLTSLGLRRDKWCEMVTAPNYCQSTVQDWLDDSQHRLLVMALTPGGQLLQGRSVHDVRRNCATAQTFRTARAPQDPGTSSDTVGAAHLSWAQGHNAAATAAIAATTVPVIMAPLLAQPGSSAAARRGKCVFFVRPHLGRPMDWGPLHAQIVCGDFSSHSAVDSLIVFMDEVIRPLLESFLGDSVFPQSVGEDIAIAMEAVRKSLKEIRGGGKDRQMLLLSLPSAAIELAALQIDQQRQLVLPEGIQSALEGMIISWSSQIHEAVNDAPNSAETSLTANWSCRPLSFGLPTQLIKFWVGRQHRLESLYRQLSSGAHKSVIVILDAVDSPYTTAFADTMKTLLCAWQESRDATLWLRPLLRQVAAFNAVSFAEAKDFVVPLVHVVHLILSHCSQYRSTQRMTELLRCVCNLFIQRANQDLELGTLFQGEAEEGLARVTKTLEVLNMLKCLLLHYKNKYGGNQTILPALSEGPGGSFIAQPPSMPVYRHQVWRFSTEDVLGYALDGHTAQLEQVQSVLEAAVTFQNLSNVEVGGNRGKVLTQRINEVQIEFNCLFRQWANVELGCYLAQGGKAATTKLPICMAFQERRRVFFAQVALLEKKLATILVQAICDCHNMDHLFKLSSMFASFLQMQVVQSELTGAVPHVLKVYDRELGLIERSIQEVLVNFNHTGVNGIPSKLTNIPPIATAMFWLENRMAHCDMFTASSLNALMRKLFCSRTTRARFEGLTARRNILITKLSNLQMRIWGDWIATADKSIAMKLRANVLKLSSPPSGLASVRPEEHREQSVAVYPDSAISRFSAGDYDGDEQTSPIIGNKVLEVNFPHDLFTLINEVNYLQSLSQLRMCPAIGGHTTFGAQYRLPQALLALHAQREAFWRRKITLTQLAECYNDVQHGCGASLEAQLIRPAVTIIDGQVASIAATLQWHQYDDQLVNEVFQRINDLHVRLEKARKNVQRVLDSTYCWVQEPLHQRSGYGRNLIDLQSRQQHLQARLQQCKEMRFHLDRMLAENFCLLFNYKPKEDFPVHQEQSLEQFLSTFPDHQRTTYQRYLQCIDDLIEARVQAAMATSLNYLLSQMTVPNTSAPTRNVSVRAPNAAGEEAAIHSAEALGPNLPQLLSQQSAQTRCCRSPWTMAVISRGMPLIGAKLCNTGAQTPLFEVKLQLHRARIVYEPSLDCEAPKSFHRYVQGLLGDIQVACDAIPRIFQRHGSGRAFGCLSSYQCSSSPAGDDSVDLGHIVSAIRSSVEVTVAAAKEFAFQFQVYAPLWKRTNERAAGWLRSPRLSEEQTALKDASGFRVLELFKREIDVCSEMHDAIGQHDDLATINSWLVVDIRPLKYKLLNLTCRRSQSFKEGLLLYVQTTAAKFDGFIARAVERLNAHVDQNELRGLFKVLEVVSRIRRKDTCAESLLKPLREITWLLLKVWSIPLAKDVTKSIDELPQRWQHLKELADSKMEALEDIKSYQRQRIAAVSILYECYWRVFVTRMDQMPIFRIPCSEVYHRCDSVWTAIARFDFYHRRIQHQVRLLGLHDPEYNALLDCAGRIKCVKQLWDLVYIIEACVNQWKASPWLCVDTDDIEHECKQFSRELRTLDKRVREWAPYLHVVKQLRELAASLRVITDLQHPAITGSNWSELMQATKLVDRFSMVRLMSFKEDASTTLSDILALGLHRHEDEVKNTVDRAIKELNVRKMLDDIRVAWSHICLEAEPHARREAVMILKLPEGLMETLEDNQIQIQNMASSKHVESLLEQLGHWQGVLSRLEALVKCWFEVQRKWMHLECIFIGSADIRAQLPEDTEYFEETDTDFIDLVRNVRKVPVAIEIVLHWGHIFDQLARLQQRLSRSEKALDNYLENKRRAFPRFYFISATDLLHLLSNGNKPELIARHFIKLFDSILGLSFDPRQERALGMHSRENDELVLFSGTEGITCRGNVEVWLQDVVEEMRRTLRDLFQRALRAYTGKSREVWLMDWPAQVALCSSQISWAAEVHSAFAWMEEGYEPAMRDLHKTQTVQLHMLTNLLLGALSPGDRQKIMTVVTIDVHCRDVIARIISARVESSTAFQWQGQLRHRWQEGPQRDDCFANICDAEFQYAYEYLGNTSRLVITPLTDRCYITLTQSLHLAMGGAPAGPAGTGKTETTKDLGRALGMMVYVFNCSEQMDYKSCGSIFKGLAMAGAWGCFDEFNRICAEVLSVVAVQVKTIQQAVKEGASTFMFMGQEITLVPSVGIFITMNPGYSGRTELPENLKSLFRPCAMVVPDLALICEIMLMAEGFLDARLLARKFITLYTLCRELLSHQDHYDWGLRAIKSVLVVAGALKREDRGRPEDQVLMRALRDFNIPKIVTEDISVFMGLIGDLFPAMDVPRKREFDFEKIVRRAATNLKLQPEENFLVKVVQLEELLQVRHAVFIVGNAGTGKTKIWQALHATYQLQDRKPVCDILNPKALNNNELYGFVNVTSREWKDGLFSSIMRDQSCLPNSHPKWIVLDGDIDPMWIESLNTLMDDNKILTLANNERIALKRDMRLIFEAGHLKAATPATVSRAGILYINPGDLGWSPFVLSWLDSRTDVVERGALTSLFEKYFPKLLQFYSTFRQVVASSPISQINLACNILQSLLDSENSQDTAWTSLRPSTHSTHWAASTPGGDESFLEITFVYATMWAFGAGLFQDHAGVDWRLEFHKWWAGEFRDIKLPTQGTIFDYHLDVLARRLVRWEELAARLPEVTCFVQNSIIPTFETARLSFFLEMLVKRNLPCMLVGPSGCGKNTVFRQLFEKLTKTSDTPNPSGSEPYGGMRAGRSNGKQWQLTVQTTHFNYYTSSEMFQKMLDSPLEKKTARSYAPAGYNCRLIYFINDLNMPACDAYGTVQPHAIMRQFMDYRQWYDRQCLQLKHVRHCQFAACMNPTAGSFSIDPRLQRHFAVFALSAPSEAMLLLIYGRVLGAHLDNPQNCFSNEIRALAPTLVKAGTALHKRMESSFLPTALKFHYAFNMRDLAQIYQGVMNSCGPPASSPAPGAAINHPGAVCNTPGDLLRLFAHEAYRTYSDRLTDLHDKKSFHACIRDNFKKYFEDFEEDHVFAEPLIYCHFAQSLADQKYMAVKDWKSLHGLLAEAQVHYNETVGQMNLVLFEEAMEHVCRINRIFEAPRNNALLVGVGGSGKQTLARLAAFISSYNVVQMQIKRDFGLQDMKDEMGTLCMKVGLKSVASVFLLSDAQIPDESLLMLVNDLLATGEIPDLFADDQVDVIVTGIRNEVKQSGAPDSRTNCWRFFVDKLRRLLKVALCFSPVGETLRVRARKFPALLTHTTTDWFHEWPKSALESVSRQFLAKLDPQILPGHLAIPVSGFMAHVHESVNRLSKIYLQNESRYNCTTPKTFLEYISLFRKVLQEKSAEHCQRIQRLQMGMAKLADCAQQVGALQEKLAAQQTELNVKNVAADNLIVVVGAESEKVRLEKHVASEEEKRVRLIEEDVCMKTKTCEEDLRRAEPALVAAHAALNTLNKNNLTELKSFGSPPKAVVNVCAAVMVLFATRGKIPRDRSWRAAKLMMARVDQFLSCLVNYNKDDIHPNIIDVLQEYLNDPEFSPDMVVQKSVAAAGLCAWVINIYRYHQVFLVVEPKQQALKDARRELCAARERLAFLKQKISNLELKLREIQAEFQKAVASKQQCQREADKTSLTLDLAHRLVNGLANENVRWRESIQSLLSKSTTLPGDMLLISSFLSYAGCFTRRYREELQHQMWMPTFRRLEPAIPHTDGVDYLSLLSDEAQIAAWNNEGLPMDRMSAENATILVNSTRWPLMIDPQLQGLKWIKRRFGDQLVVLRCSEKHFVECLERSITTGRTVLIELIGETLDNLLEPLLSRALIKRGQFIRLGERELDFHRDFRLLLHTKLANPHYKPEIQAQTTLINFTVTPDGLEEQLLAKVVNIERPDLEALKSSLTAQQNKFKISLKVLEDELLTRLASAGEGVLDNHELVANLETTKRTVNEIGLKVSEALATCTQIDETRNLYRPAAKRASIMYFVLADLCRINPVYRYSLKFFMHVFKQAIVSVPKTRVSEKRVAALVDAITSQTFQYALRGLFQDDKLIFAAHMTLRILAYSEGNLQDEMDFLLRFPHDPNSLSPVEFISRSAWGGIQSLAQMENFYGIDKDIETNAKRWHVFIADDTPEASQFPGEWKHRTPLQKLCIVRALRPDRMIIAIRLFIEVTLGRQYSSVRTFSFSDIFMDVPAVTPIFFILSPGVDPIYDVERLGQQLGFGTATHNLVNVSLGQGQEIIAEQALRSAVASGDQWVVLQNIHLVTKWLPTLEKLIEQIAHEHTRLNGSKFRLFISAEPAREHGQHIIPHGILESSLKIVSEPPSGMAANMHLAWDNFCQDQLESCTQESEFKAILFALCYFHAVASQRQRYGPIGWNKRYPFNVGDLTISASVLHNYLERSNRIPWEDLRYLFGEIMYGGHITDDWDRRLCQTFFTELLQQELISGDLQLCPGFPAPPNLDFPGYHKYISELLPEDCPVAYGLHPNAAIGLATSASEYLLKTVFELQPRQTELSAICSAPREELVRILAEDYLDKLLGAFCVDKLTSGCGMERKTPFVVVAFQECDRMNILTQEIRRSLRELVQGLKGELTITGDMERLDFALFYNRVPETWTVYAYPSMLGLQAWFADLQLRIRALFQWLRDFQLPPSMWLGGLFNPQSFLTAIMQECARKHDLPLDRMRLTSDVTKHNVGDIILPPTDGAYIHGLFLEGANWDCQRNSLGPLEAKQLMCAMPVLCVKSVVRERHEADHTYDCPVYKTRQRGETYVWTFNLKTHERPSTWILAGAALLLQP